MEVFNLVKNETHNANAVTATNIFGIAEIDYEQMHVDTEERHIKSILELPKSIMNT